MPKLETQINQIFLNPGEDKKVSLVLFEERLSPDQHLFLLAELREVQKKMDHNDLGKISEAIISSFKANARLDGEQMLQESLKQANAALGSIAHKGRKSWLGKFSALVALKSGSDVYLANSGRTCAWLKRKNSLNELLGQDKAETQPLKIFSNFTSGRLAEGDSLVLASSSIFNYVSVELFSKMLSTGTLQQACTGITEILRGSARAEEGFAVFMLGMSRRAMATLSLPEPVEPAIVAVEKPVPAFTPAATKDKKPAARTDSIAKSAPAMPIYAPLPEDMGGPETEPKPGFLLSMPSMPRLAMPKFSMPSLPRPNFSSFSWDAIRSFSWLPRMKYMQGVTWPGKFFLASFIVFAVLFGMNLAAYGVRKSQTDFDARFNTSAEAFTGLLSEAESSLLYRNQSQAMKQMSSAESELVKLSQLDPELAKPFREKFDEMNNKVNRVTVLRGLSSTFDMPYPVTTMARAGNGYLISNDNPNSLGIYAEGVLRNLFMLNSTDGTIRGISHVSGVGNMVASKDKIYLANETSKEFEQMEYISGADLLALKFLDPNRIYAINKATNQVIRMTASSAAVSAPTNLLKGTINMADAQDLAVDTDIYVLFSDRLVKYSGTGNVTSFQLTALSDPARQMTRVRVGNQIYILDPISNRMLIYSRTGELLNQVHFPELSDMRDMYVDEAQRQMYILNGSKVYRITF